MDTLLGVLLAAAVFAVFIFLVDRSAKYITLIGVAVIAIAVVAILWRVGG